MLRAAGCMFLKDVRLSLAGPGGIQAVLLGLLLIFVFSLSLPPGERMLPLGAATIFWLSTAFAQTLIFNLLYGLEEGQDLRSSLLLVPELIQYVWLGKALAGFGLLLLVQLVFVLATIVFLGQGLEQPWALLGVLPVNLGICAVGSLLGAICQGQAGKESLLSIILFPLIIPILLAGIQILAFAFSGQGEFMQWLAVALGFAAIFGALSLVLFPFIFGAD